MFIQDILTEDIYNNLIKNISSKDHFQIPLLFENCKIEIKGERTEHTELWQSGYIILLNYHSKTEGGGYGEKSDVFLKKVKTYQTACEWFEQSFGNFIRRHCNKYEGFKLQTQLSFFD